MNTSTHHQHYLLLLCLLAFPWLSMAQTTVKIHVTDTDNHAIAHMDMAVDMCGKIKKVRTDAQGTATLNLAADKGCGEARIKMGGGNSTLRSIHSYT